MKKRVPAWNKENEEKRKKALARLQDHELASVLFHCDYPDTVVAAIQRMNPDNLRQALYNTDVSQTKLLRAVDHIWQWLVSKYDGTDTASAYLNSVLQLKGISWLDVSRSQTIRNYILDEKINDETMYYGMVKSMDFHGSFAGEITLAETILGELLKRITKQPLLDMLITQTDEIFKRSTILFLLGNKEEAAKLRLAHGYYLWRYGARLSSGEETVAIGDIEDQAFLETHALSAENADHREAAVKKVKNLDVIDKVVRTDKANKVLLAALQSASQPAIAFAAMHSDWEVMLKAMGLLEDEQQLRLVLDFYSKNPPEQLSKRDPEWYQEMKVYIHLELHDACGKLGHQYDGGCKCVVCGKEEHTFTSIPYSEKKIEISGTEMVATCGRCGAKEFWGTREKRVTCTACGGSGYITQYSSQSGQGSSWETACGCGGGNVTEYEKYSYIRYPEEANESFPDRPNPL